MAIGAEALKVIGVSLKVTVAMRSPNVIDLCCDLNVAAEFTVLAKRPSPQGGRARDLAPVSRAIICSIGIEGRAVTHVDLPVLACAVPAAATVVHRYPAPRWPHWIVVGAQDFPAIVGQAMHGEAGRPDRVCRFLPNGINRRQIARVHTHFTIIGMKPRKTNPSPSVGKAYPYTGKASPSVGNRVLILILILLLLFNKRDHSNCLPTIPFNFDQPQFNKFFCCSISCSTGHLGYLHRQHNLSTHVLALESLKKNYMS